MWPIDQIKAEWPVLKPMIAAAPLTFIFLCLVLLAIGFGISSWLGRRERNASRAERDSAEGRTKLAEKEREIYKAEAENYRKKIEETKGAEPSQALPLVYGNSAVQSAFLEIKDKGGQYTFYGSPSDWSDKDIGKFAAFARLRDAGLANIRATPNTTTVTSTSAAIAMPDLSGLIRRQLKDFKANEDQ